MANWFCKTVMEGTKKEEKKSWRRKWIYYIVETSFLGVWAAYVCWSLMERGVEKDEENYSIPRWGNSRIERVIGRSKKEDGPCS